MTPQDPNALHLIIGTVPHKGQRLAVDTLRAQTPADVPGREGPR